MNIEENSEMPPFPQYSGPGCYPLYYLVEGCTTCNECAKEAWKEGTRFHPLGYVNWETPHDHCEECGVLIEMAYPEEKEA